MIESYVKAFILCSLVGIVVVYTLRYSLYTLDVYGLYDSALRALNQSVHPSVPSINNVTSKQNVTLEIYMRGDKSTAIQFQNSPQDFSKKQNESTKVVLYHNTWFGAAWSSRFGPPSNLIDENCPSHKCEFTNNKSRWKEADAILFTPSGSSAKLKQLKKKKLPHQFWVYVNVEALLAPEKKFTLNDLPGKKFPFTKLPGKTRSSQSSFTNLFNWTMTYHRGSDIVAHYGYFLPKDLSKTRPLRANFMNYESPEMKAYLKDLKSGVILADVMGDSWLQFVNRTKIVAWMSSHCYTYSKREVYIRDLQKYVDVGTYGGCGRRACLPKSPYDAKCWINELRPKYLFYMSMENSLCDDYITEKLYLPLLHGLVPVVWGGSNYTQFLPPNSYIDATKFSPAELTEVLHYYQKDKVAYGRLHLWRKYWTVHMGGSMCELCAKLHNTEDNQYKVYDGIDKWIKRSSTCYTITDSQIQQPKNYTIYNWNPT